MLITGQILFPGEDFVGVGRPHSLGELTKQGRVAPPERGVNIDVVCKYITVNVVLSPCQVRRLLTGRF